MKKRGIFLEKIGVVLLSAALLAGLTGCSSAKTENSASSTGADGASVNGEEDAELYGVAGDRQVLTLGCISLEENMQEAVVAFNKHSQDYFIEVVDYAPNITWTSDGAWDVYDDAQTKLTLDIMSGRAPDMFVAKDVNLDIFAENGVIADLSTFLENSSEICREDLFESVLNVYIKNDILSAIPLYFTVSTLVGRENEIGQATGWTLDEMIAFAKEYPEADIFSSMNRSTILQLCLMADMDSYIDFETGECYFNTPEFQKVLEFAASYSDDIDYNKSETEVLRNHEALLLYCFIYEPEAWQRVEMKFQTPIHAIGFPTADSNGILARATEAVCISARSENSQGAWSFLEFMLSEEQQLKFVDRMKEKSEEMQFPMRQSVYEAMIEEAMTPNYMYDNAGNILVTEEGYLEMPKSVSSYGSDTYELYAMTEAQAQELRSMIDRVDGLVASDRQLMKIVFEEAAHYFDGKKSVEEVMDIIQNRAVIYINENR